MASSRSSPSSDLAESVLPDLPPIPPLPALPAPVAPQLGMSSHRVLLGALFAAAEDKTRPGVRFVAVRDGDFDVVFASEDALSAVMKGIRRTFSSWRNFMRALNRSGGRRTCRRHKHGLAVNHPNLKPGRPDLLDKYRYRE